MKDTLHFLAELEKTAAQFYRESAVYFHQDAELSSFLSRLEEDELWHYEIIRDIIDQHPGFNINISVERQDDIVDRILWPLKKFKEHQYTKTDLMVHIIEIEFSEWNDVFLFVVSSMNDHNPQFKHISAQLQNHLDTIEQQVMSVTDDSTVLDKLFSVKRIWDKRILIVDDDDMIRRLLVRMFGKRFQVEEARNGKEALAAIQRTFFDVILSDVNMPLMDGWALFDELTKQSYDITKKFIFLTGDRKHENLFVERGIRYFFKPFPLDRMLKAVDEIVMKATPDHSNSTIQ